MTAFPDTLFPEGWEREKDRFKEETLQLAEQSKYAARIMPLVRNPELGERPYGFRLIALAGETPGKFSNCHGTTLYVLGEVDAGRPEFASVEEMLRFLDRSCDEVDKAGEIVSFWQDRELCHTGVYIGDFEGRPVLFHQGDTGTRFSLNWVDCTYGGCFERYFKVR